MSDTTQATASIRRPIGGQLKEGDNYLPQLADQIKREHKAIRDALAVKGLVPKAITIGNYLNEAKDKVEHGQWLSWLKDSCDLSDRTANRYMSLANNKAKLEEKAKGKPLAEKTLNWAIAQVSGNGGGGSISDRVDTLVKSLIKQLKELKKSNEDTAIAAAAELVKQLKLVDLVEE